MNEKIPNTLKDIPVQKTIREETQPQELWSACTECVKDPDYHGDRTRQSECRKCHGIGFLRVKARDA